MLIIQSNDVKKCYESYKQMFFPHQCRLQRQLLIFHYIEKIWIYLGKVFLLLGFFLIVVIVWDCIGYIFLFGIVYICCVFIFCGVLVFGGVRDILNARAIYLQIEEAWA